MKRADSGGMRVANISELVAAPVVLLCIHLAMVSTAHAHRLDALLCKNLFASGDRGLKEFSASAHADNEGFGAIVVGLTDLRYPAQDLELIQTPTRYLLVQAYEQPIGIVVGFELWRRWNLEWQTTGMTVTEFKQNLTSMFRAGADVDLADPRVTVLFRRGRPYAVVVPGPWVPRLPVPIPGFERFAREPHARNDIDEETDGPDAETDRATDLLGGGSDASAIQVETAIPLDHFWARFGTIPLWTRDLRSRLHDYLNAQQLSQTVYLLQRRSTVLAAIFGVEAWQDLGVNIPVRPVLLSTFRTQVRELLAHANSSNEALPPALILQYAGRPLAVVVPSRYLSSLLLPQHLEFDIFPFRVEGDRAFGTFFDLDRVLSGQLMNWLTLRQGSMELTIQGGPPVEIISAEDRMAIPLDPEAPLRIRFEDLDVRGTNEEVRRVAELARDASRFGTIINVYSTRRRGAEILFQIRPIRPTDTVTVPDQELFQLPELAE